MTTFGDQLKQFGGVPVASNEFAGWWGNDVWFVDYDNGIRANDEGHNNMGKPQKDLYRAIADAAAGDIIYVRPRTGIGGTYWYTNVYITPASTEQANWTIPMAKSYLSIIGTMKSLPQGGQIHRPLLKGYTGVATPTINVLAPYFCMENMGISHVSGQSSGLIKADYTTITTQRGYSAVINNCAFRNYAPSISQNAAVWFETGIYNMLVNSTFWKCRIGVELASAGRINEGNAVVNCDFYGAASDITCDIRTGDTAYTLIDSNRFNHGQPSHAAGGAPVGKYVYVGGAAGGGLLSNNYFATNSSSMATACTLSSIVDVGNKCNADSVWMK